MYVREFLVSAALTLIRNKTSGFSTDLNITLSVVKVVCVQLPMVHVRPAGPVPYLFLSVCVSSSFGCDSLLVLHFIHAVLHLYLRDPVLAVGLNRISFPL